VALGTRVRVPARTMFFMICAAATSLAADDIAVRVVWWVGWKPERQRFEGRDEERCVSAMPGRVAAPARRPVPEAAGAGRGAGAGVEEREEGEKEEEKEEEREEED